MNPLITIYLPTKNRLQTLKRAVNSVLNQTYKNFELIVVDDASTDNTLHLVQSFNCEKLKIIPLKKNVGKSDAVKIATKNLKADVLFFCDGDLHNFKNDHIKQVLEPFKYKKMIMSVGIRDYGKVVNFLSKNIFPLITGERAIPYSVFKEVSKDPLMKNYGLEVVLNNYCKINNILIYKSILKGLRQTNKPTKRKNGFYLLLKQSIELTIVISKLKFRNYKNSIKRILNKNN